MKKSNKAFLLKKKKSIIERTHGIKLMEATYREIDTVVSQKGHVGTFSRGLIANMCLVVYFMFAKY